MKNYLETAKGKRPKLKERALPGAHCIEVECPVCGAHRPGFCITELSAAQTAALGHAWACDGCISHLNRMEQANA